MFPEVLSAADEYEVISFNDVLEHLPDPREAIAACYRHLVPGGLLSINIPTSRGLVYRSARRGLPVTRALFERLWQVGLPSPHLWYFNGSSLLRLCTDAGFDAAAAEPLQSVKRDGLWQRAHFDRAPSVVSVAGVGALLLAAPLLNSPRASDIMHVVARKPLPPAEPGL